MAEDDNTQEEQTQEEQAEQVEEQEQEQPDDTGGDGGGDDSESEQIQRLRREREQAEQRAEETESEVKQEVEQLKNEVEEIKFENRISQYAEPGSDKAKALKQEFQNYRPGETDDEAIAERLEKANNLVSAEPDTPSAADGQAASAGGDTNKDTVDTDENGVPESTKEQGEALGLDEEDYEKYGDQVTQ